MLSVSSIPEFLASPAKRRNFWVSGGRFEEMCMDDGSLEKKGSRDEGVAGVRGAGDSGGGSSLMWDSWLSRVSLTGGLLSRSVACTRKKASTAGWRTGDGEKTKSMSGEHPQSGAFNLPAVFRLKYPLAQNSMLIVGLFQLFQALPEHIP